MKICIYPRRQLTVNFFEKIIEYTQNTFEKYSVKKKEKISKKKKKIGKKKSVIRREHFRQFTTLVDVVAP